LQAWIGVLPVLHNGDFLPCRLIRHLGGFLLHRSSQGKSWSYATPQAFSLSARPAARTFFYLLRGYLRAFMIVSLSASKPASGSTPSRVWPCSTTTVDPVYARAAEVVAKIGTRSLPGALPISCRRALASSPSCITGISCRAALRDTSVGSCFIGVCLPKGWS